ncbi:MAG: class I SAM-dependent methyltransferase [Clostridiales bacterium]|nr:class I SAM-dependent methyltransferase [Clostridiales bacterium]
MADKIQSAYKSSKNIYDDVLTQGNLFSRLYIRFFWSGTDDNEIARRILQYIPDNFSGTLLDVPVGTAVFTESKWAALKGAYITCLDYSDDMLSRAKARLGQYGHIGFVQGDVGNLPMQDETYDTVLSMNGFHAFPDKPKAFSETYRVLKQGGEFIACFYIKGKSRITDWLVSSILSKKGWFTPPFQTEDELRSMLGRYYAETEIHTDGSIVYFRCKK